MFKRGGEEMNPDKMSERELRQEVKRLREALREISESKFCSYENTGSGSYGIGVTDGHRYCSSIAKKALQANED